MRNSSKDASFSRTNAVLKQTGTTSSVDKSGVFMISRDSSIKAYTVQFWPKGVFKFSPDNGFEGEAKKVLINGYMKSDNRTVQQKYAEERTAAKVNSTLQQKQLQRRDQKIVRRKRSASFSWMVAGLIILVLTGLWFFKKLK